MTRFLLSEEAEFDIADILNYLHREAGAPVAERYRQYIGETIRNVRMFPNSGAPRPHLGPHLRIAVVAPYVLFYDYDEEGDLLTLIRVLHGRADAAAKLAER